MSLLSPGDPFPTLDVQLVGGSSLTLPEALGGKYGVVLFNRGSWCPFCTGQLRQFQRLYERFTAADIEVLSLSVDNEATAAELVKKNKIDFLVGHSADAPRLAELTGAFVNTEPSYVQATGFVLDPAGRVVLSTYSSGAIGRLTAEDTLAFIEHIRQQTH